MSVDFHPRRNIIVGRNGQGKTNLVEAISLIGHGKSFRTSDTDQLLSWGSDNGSVFGKVNDSLSEFEIGVSLDKAGKQAYIDGEKVNSLEKYIGRLPCVIFSPGDLALVKGGPVERRRFIDRHVAELNPSSIRDAVSFSRALKSKTQLLLAGHPGRDNLDPWNRIIAECSARIYAARLAFVSNIALLAAGFYKTIAPTDEALSIRLKSNVRDAAEDVSAASVYEILNRKMSMEVGTRRASIGPHRDDLLVFLGDRESRAFASQGQSRSIVLALKMAVISHFEMEKGESPVVLLDDVDSELDSQRSSGVFSMIADSGRQVFITGTSVPACGSFSNTDSLSLQVEGGTICRCLD